MEPMSRLRHAASVVAACIAEGGGCSRSIRRAARREGGRKDRGKRSYWHSVGTLVQGCHAKFKEKGTARRTPSRSPTSWWVMQRTCERPFANQHFPLVSAVRAVHQNFTASVRSRLHSTGCGAAEGCVNFMHITYSHMVISAT